MKKIVLDLNEQKTNFLEELLSKAREKKSDYFLREAIRIGYYIIFQEISLFAIENLITNNDINENEWIKIFRQVEHGELKRKLISNEMKFLLGEAKNISRVFPILQYERMKCDYDPRPLDITIDEFDTLFKEAIKALASLHDLPKTIKITIATHILFKNKDRQ